MKITIIGLNHNTLNFSNILMGENAIELVSTSSGILYQDLRNQLEGTRIHFTSSLHQSINPTDIIFIDEDSNDYDVDDLRNIYDTLERIDQELEVPENKLVVITRLLPTGSIKTLKSYASKHNFKFNFAYLPNIDEDRLVVGVNREVDAKLIKKCFTGLKKEILSVSPEMSEYYWLIKESNALIKNSFLSQVLNASEKLGLNQDKLLKLLQTDYSSVGFLCKREKSLKQLSKTLNSSGSPSSIIDSALLQNITSHNKILNELKGIYSTLENNNIGIIIGHPTRFNNMIADIEKTGANIHVYYGVNYTGHSHHKLHKDLHSLFKECKDIVIFNILDTKSWNLRGKNIFDPFRNLNKDQIKTTNHYW